MEENNNNNNDDDPQSPNENETFHDTIEGEINTTAKPEKQETSVAAEMKKKKRKALLDLRLRLEDSIYKRSLVGEQYKSRKNLKEIELWGVPLLPSKGYVKTDIILKKFLKAKDYNAQNALEMLGNTLMWREDFNIDKIFDENFGADLENIGYVEGVDTAGHPLCYQCYEVFKDKEILRKRLGTKESVNQFLRWRIKLMEECIRKLDFKPDGTGSDSVIQIIDVKNIPRPFLNEMVQGSKTYFSILQDNYPGIIYRFVIVNVPMWFFAFYTMNMRLMTRRYKVMYVKPSAITDTLLKFIEPEQLLAQYGGVRRQGGEFSPDEKVTELKIKIYGTESIEILMTEAGMTVIWDLTVTGSEVSYKEEFVPEDEGSYNVLLQKGKQIGRMSWNSFHVTEPGKILITFANPTSKSRKVFYRYKLKPIAPMNLISITD